MRQKTTADYLAQLKRHYGVTSDYALAKKLGIGVSLMSSYRTRRSRFDDYMCMRVAKELGIEPLEVIADIHAEREKRPEVKRFWSGLVTKGRNDASAEPAKKKPVKRLTTRAYIDLLKRRFGVQDETLAVMLDIPHSTVESYRKDGAVLDDATALRVAKLLDMDAAEVLLNIHTESAKDAELHEVWKRIANVLHGATTNVFAMVILTALLLIFPENSMACGFDDTVNVYYVK